MRHVSGDEGVSDPASQIDHAVECVRHVSELGCEIVRELHERDGGKAAG